VQAKARVEGTKQWKGRVLVGTATAVAMALTVSGVAWSSGSADSSVINACVNDKSGVIYLSPATSRPFCSKGFTHLAWSAGGRGADGREVELRLDEESGFLQWRYQGSTDPWRNIVDIRSIRGSDGADGRSVELRVEDGKIEYRLTGDDEWRELADLADFKGDKGDPGADGTDGREVEVRVDADKIQYRLTGDTSWTDLVDVNDLQGAQGPQGEQGAKGDTGDTGAKGDTGDTGVKGDTGDTGAKGDTGADGRDVEVRVDGGWIQYRLSGDEWTDLIDVADLKGEKGDTGETGAPGAPGEAGAQGDKGETGDTGDKGETGETGTQGPKGDPGETGTQGPKGDPGRTPELRINGGYFQWRYAGEPETDWANLSDLATLRGTSLLYGAGKLAGSGTFFFQPGGVFDQYTGKPNRSQAEIPVAVASTMSKLTVRIGTAPDSSASTKGFTFTLLKVSGTTETTGPTCTISGTATTCAASTGSLSFDAGDRVSLRVVPNSSPNIGNGDMAWSVSVGS
jgi:hypothetical protein